MNRRMLWLGILLFFFTQAHGETTAPAESRRGPVIDPGRSVKTLDIDVENRVHRAGAMWMNITNWGFFGNYSVRNENQMTDPEYPGTWAPQCEFPGGSGVQYLYQGALWLGALIVEEGYQYARVSTGTEGWIFPRIHEFYPGEKPDPIIERSTNPNAYNRLGDFVYSEDAVSEQDFVITYTDTLTDPFYVEYDPRDGPHEPLGIKISQTSYSWSYAYARDFIIIDWEIENIADNYLKNLYVGLYVDADVGAIWEQQVAPSERGHVDDICGFQRFNYFTDAEGRRDSSVINTAWIADNDGRPVPISSGNDFVTPHVTGVRVVRAPNPRLKTSFNWWISNDDPDLDFGPAWEDDFSEGDWTSTLGTPLGDARKYFILGNREFDYDQVYVDQLQWVESHPQETFNPANGEPETHVWREPEDQPVLTDLANGYDTRYLLSWGPLGIYDYTNEATGERIYRLNPGESFSMTIGYVAGENFHNRNNPQTSNVNIDPSKFDFTDLQYNADWVAKVYDNPMVDTNGDGWFGEDTGSDLLFAMEEGDSVIIDGLFIGFYPGPDPDGSELNGKLDPGEDLNPYKPRRYDYTSGNDLLDLGDGEPDFRGPPPPPIPQLTHIPHETDLILRWTKFPSEDTLYQDPFSRLQDFEGYRIYWSTTGLEAEYSYVEEFDRVDFAYFTEHDSLLTVPVEDTTGLPRNTEINGVYASLKPVGPNVGFDDIWDPEGEEYVYRLPNTHAIIPRWYAVTAYDYGDPKSGTPPLETSKSANAIYIAPSGNPDKAPKVVPNPYRADQDYTMMHGSGYRWENRNDGTIDFFPQVDRRIYFYNIPAQCMIRIYTVSGDLVEMIYHDAGGNALEQLDFAEGWDLNSRNKQQVVSGLYIFSVEDLTPENKGEIRTGKFVIIR